MNKKYLKLLTEEINSQVENLKLDSPRDVIHVLKELFYLNTEKLMGNIGSVEVGGDDEINQEIWDWFLQNLASSIKEEEEEWVTAFREVKEKILTYKYFTRSEMIDIDSVEKHLRMELKPYFTALQNHRGLKDFRAKCLILPTSILYCLVRYIFSLSDQLKSSIKVTNSDIQKRIEKCTVLRMQVVEKIAQVSNGYQDVLDMKELKELYDNGVLFEDNMINRGVNEYMSKLLNHKEAFVKLCEIHPSAILNDMRQQLEASPAYLEHVKAIKSQTGQEYFTSKGAQIGRRFDNDIEVVKNEKFDGYVVDNKSRFKEPTSRIQSVSKPWEQGGAGPAGGGMGMDGAPGGGGGGSEFGGGLGASGFDASGLPGGDFAPDGAEGEIPGMEGEDDAGPIGQEEDGTPIPDNDGDGLPDDFGTIEDKGGEAPVEEPEDDKK